MNSFILKLKYAWELMRPFTLIAPALGMLSGAVTAYGAFPHFSHYQSSFSGWITEVILGTVAASLLNAGSNIINQVFDIEIDKINKPKRVLPEGRLSINTALFLSVLFYILSLTVAFFINTSCFILFFLAAVATVVYSVPPFRTKRFGWWANVTIAIPRGVLLKVAGWSLSKTILSPEAWLIGAVFGLFLLGATSSKDFSDIEGDKHCGCKTLPIIYGTKKAIRIIYPFYTLPFLFLILGTVFGFFTGNKIALIVLGVVCLIWGHKVIMMLLKDPSEQITENHPSWSHMYFMMFTLQIGFMAAYLI